MSITHLIYLSFTTGSPVIVNGDEFENIEIAGLTPEEQARHTHPLDSSSPHHHHHRSQQPSHPVDSPSQPSARQCTALEGGPLSLQQQGDPLGALTDWNRNVGKPGMMGSAAPAGASCDIIITDADVNNSSGDMLRDLVKNKVCHV